ncbi:MAG: hypothetical protein SOY54_08215 [Bacilli bacterium]|nr:hypothetical protein [Bacilli bacterium]
MKKEIKVKNEQLYYNNVNLNSLAEKYGTPLKVTFLDLIKERVVSLKETFDKVIKENNYQGKFIYLNANKANYGVEEIETAFIYADGLECSSYHDLLLTVDIINKYPKMKTKPIVCNGYKKIDYITEIIKLSESGYNVSCIIDNALEYDLLKKYCHNRLEVGIRVHLEALYAEEDETIKNDRFGVTSQEFDYILNDLENHQNLILKTIHFHQRGFDYEKDKFEENICKTFEKYYVRANKKYPSCCEFDMGGGTPLPVHYDFDYSSWAKLLVDILKDLSITYGVTMPDIISENGKYSQKDSTINIYEIVGVKNTDEIPWYIIDGSLLIAMPEAYALGEEILLHPVNNINDKMIKTRLAGITCDCDDIYYEKDKGYILMPEKTLDNKVFVAILGTGSYQNSMNGKGGVHHCLIPEEKDLLIYTNNGKEIHKVRGELQEIEDMERILKFKK